MRRAVTGTRGEPLIPLLRIHLLELRDWPRNGQQEIDFSGAPIAAYAAEHGEWRGYRGIGAYGWAHCRHRRGKVASSTQFTAMLKHQKNPGRAGGKA